MLAQNFKTPADLGITDVEFDALLKVLGMLEREEIPYAPGYGEICRDAPESPTNRPEPKFFNMGFVTGEHDCGTAGCIKGWAQHVAQQPLFNRRSKPLAQLFQMGADACDESLPISLEEIKPGHAAIALRNFLTHGEARWAEALAA